MDYFNYVQKNIAVIGMGYVGLPLAISFSKSFKVIGFDIDTTKIVKLKEGIDITNEVGNKVLRECKIRFTNDEKEISKASFIIVAVPTPVNKNNIPDLTNIINATNIIGRNLSKNTIIVYESTVYPGLIEEKCIPILERISNMKCKMDFKVGYSPERINPGDKTHRLDNVVKIVSGIDEESLEIIAKLYNSIVPAGIYKAPSIKIAEAAKVIENAQRDINIAFINELSIIFNKMGLDTLEVLKAASTKWNFITFYPGLVGGHCIGVDPYYLTFKSQELGYQPEVILAGRRINNFMGKYIAENIIKCLAKNKSKISGANVLIMGITFKENVPDIRNSKVVDIVNELKEYEINVLINDPIVNPDNLLEEYGLKLSNKVLKVDAIVFAVPHKEYLSIKLDDIIKITDILIDIKGIFNKNEAINKGLKYWRL